MLCSVLVITRFDMLSLVVLDTYISLVTIPL